MSKRKRLISFLLALCLFASLCTVFACAENVGVLRYSHIDFLSANLQMGALGRTTCFSYVELTYPADTGYLYMYLQRLVNGTWENVRSYWLATGSDYVAQEQYYYVTSGYYYRVYAVATVYDQNGALVESASIISNTVYY